ncbi:MAG: tRNA-queuosine alpha-mannosyltransferase domain-containing protein, partial [Bacteroidota bacterium]
MLNLAEFSGLADESVRRLPKISYFHENQLTYPVQVA